MSRHVTISEIRSRHSREERRLILGALDRNGWRLTIAAKDLDVEVSSLQALIRTHDLLALYQERAHPRGRPKSIEKQEVASEEKSA